MAEEKTDAAQVEFRAEIFFFIYIVFN